MGFIGDAEILRGVAVGLVGSSSELKTKNEILVISLFIEMFL